MGVEGTDRLDRNRVRDSIDHIETYNYLFTLLVDPYNINTVCPASYLCRENVGLASSEAEERLRNKRLRENFSRE